MHEEPKSIWRKPLRGPAGLFAWFVLLTGAVFLMVCCVPPILVKDIVFPGKIMLLLAFSVFVAVLAILIRLFIRWLWCWRNFRRFLIGAACFVTLIALTYVVENVRGKWAWEKFKREWEAKGERFNFASLAPPPVPDDQNFAMTPIVASCYARVLDKNGHPLRPNNTNVVYRLEMTTCLTKPQPPANGIGNWQKLTVSDLPAWQQYYRALPETTNGFPVAPQPQSPAADVLLALSKYDPVIEELREASRLPSSRFPLEYGSEATFDILLPHLGALKGCSLVMQLRAIAEVQGGQNDKALADVKLALRLADSIRTEPFLISHLVRIAIVKIALQPIWEGLAERKWSDAQLVELDRDLAKLNFVSDYTLAMRCEMACQCSVSDFLRRNPEKIYDMGFGEDDPLPPGSPAYLAYLIPSGWFYQNQLRCARLMVQYFLPSADVEQGIVSPTIVRRADAALEADLEHHSPYNRLEQLMLPALTASLKKFASGQSFVDLARMACALERHRFAHGEYPASLDMLTPQFIAKLPHDVIGGQPLKYRRTDDGQFLLYSVGWNEIDDGGEVVLNVGSSASVDITKGDWVWRYPAK